MIGGAAQADIECLLSVRKGEFEAGFEQGGQTREHAMLAYTLGVQKLKFWSTKWTVAIGTKRDSHQRKNLRHFYVHGVQSQARLRMVARGLHGDNLSKRLPEGKAPWIKDRRCLLEIMDDIELAFRDPEGPLRIPILEKFSDRGTWIMGKVEQGTPRMGQKYIIMPNGTDEDPT